MKEVVVNDSNILIDMHTAGLLEYIHLSDVSFHTVDYVVKELLKSPYKRPLISRLIKEGVLYVAETSPKKMLEVESLYNAYSNRTNLSIVDCSVMQYAKENHYRLLTGDKKLKTCAIDNGVMVSGILWVVDAFIEEEIITPFEMIEKLNYLLSQNNRLPKKLFEWEIEQLKEMK